MKSKKELVEVLRDIYAKKVATLPGYPETAKVLHVAGAEGEVTLSVVVFSNPAEKSVVHRSFEAAALEDEAFVVDVVNDLVENVQIITG